MSVVNSPSARHRLVEAAPAPGPGRLPSLTGLRAFAALAVFFSHVQFLMDGAPRRATAAVFEHSGAVGVTFFFVLSGFVLTWRRRADDHDQRRFWIDRVARIYPAYAVALLLGLAVTAYRYGFDGLVSRMAACLLLVQSWIPDSTYYWAINQPSWTLACEAFFYLCFPLAFRWLIRMRRQMRLLAVGALFVGVVVLDLLWLTLGQQWTVWLTTIMPATRLVEFVVGITLALEVRRGLRFRIRRDIALFSMFLAAFIAQTAPFEFARTVVPVPAVCLVLASYAAANVAGRRSRVVDSRFVVFMGEISFSFYLVHQLVIRVMNVLGVQDSWWSAVAVTAIALLLGVLSAWLLYRTVEKPLHGRINRWLGPKLPRGHANVDAPGSTASEPAVAHGLTAKRLPM